MKTLCNRRIDNCPGTLRDNKTCPKCPAYDPSIETDTFAAGIRKKGVVVV